jgi:hypothetical protein
VKVEMSKDHFTTCDNFYLGWECIEPVVMEIRGKAPDYKERVYSQLNEGQKALFSFYIYFNHAKNSLEEFIWWSNHYYSQPEIWAELKKGIRYLNLTNFEIFVEKFEEMREEMVEVRSSSIDIDTYCTLFFIFGDHVTSTLEQISHYIKTHPDEFIQFKDE